MDDNEAEQKLWFGVLVQLADDLVVQRNPGRESREKLKRNAEA